MKYVTQYFLLQRRKKERIVRSFLLIVGYSDSLEPTILEVETFRKSCLLPWSKKLLQKPCQSHPSSDDYGPRPERVMSRPRKLRMQSPIFSRTHCHQFKQEHCSHVCISLGGIGKQMFLQNVQNL